MESPLLVLRMPELAVDVGGVCGAIVESEGGCSSATSHYIVSQPITYTDPFQASAPGVVHVFASCL